MKNNNKEYFLEQIIYQDSIDCLISSTLLEKFYENNKLEVTINFFKYDQSDNLIEMLAERFKIFYFQEENSYWLINSDEIYNLI